VSEISLTPVLLAYFVMAAVMFGGGLIQAEDAQPLGLAYDEDELESGDVEPEQDQYRNTFENFISYITPLVGILVAAINFLVTVVAFINWPIFALSTAGAPLRVIVLLGGTMTAMFYMAAIAFLTRIG
jgi:hypothetical protein